MSAQISFDPARWRLRVFPICRRADCVARSEAMQSGSTSMAETVRKPARSKAHLDHPRLKIGQLE